MRTIKVIDTTGNLILTSDGQFLMGNPEADSIVNILTGEAYTVAGCTTDSHGQLETIDID